MSSVYESLKLVEYKDDGGLLERAVVVDGYVSKERKEIGFSLKTSDDIPQTVVDALKNDIMEKYNALGVKIKVEKIETAEIGLLQRIAEYCKAKSAVCNGFFKDAEMEQHENEVIIKLAHGGKTLLEASGIDRIASAFASEQLKRTVTCKFAEEERQRSEVVSQPSMVAPAVKPKPAKAAKPASVAGDLIFGKDFTGEPLPVLSLQIGDSKVVVEGDVFLVDIKPTRKESHSIFTFAITDGVSSISAKCFVTSEIAKNLKDSLNSCGRAQVFGDVVNDDYTHSTQFMVKSIRLCKKAMRMDSAEEKRIELHLHTNMSAMDAVTPIGKYIETAKAWGVDTVAITDHGVIQAFPEAYTEAKKQGYEGKIMYGVEAYFVNDSVALINGKCDDSFDDDIICFDIETTGLSPKAERITEIGAVRVRGGKIVESFDTFVNPEMPIPAKITQLTGITDDMVKDAPCEAEALRKFMEFAGGSMLVAHNAEFDISFIKAACLRCEIVYNPPYLDTLMLARMLFKNLSNYKLDTVAEFVKAGSFNHHRACDDADVLGRILIKMMERIKSETGICTFKGFNTDVVAKYGNISPKQLPTYHMVIFAKNKAALRNLFIIISDAHVNNFYKRPRTTKSILEKYRDGLIIGSACEAGELYRAILNKASDSEIRKIAAFYDYFEIQPIANNRFLIADGKVSDEEELRDINRRIVELGKELNKPVVATGDVHFLNPEDEVYRKVLLVSQGYADGDRQMPLYLKTTDEMLQEFSYLGKETAHDVVIKNPRLIADMCEVYSPLPPNQLFKPTIEGSESELREGCFAKAKELYGDPLPEWIEERLNNELIPIIENGYSVTYIIAKRLVKYSNDHGYLVGSRGSVGSSFAAHMAEITEVNALPPHYRCPNCKHVEVVQGYECGIDLPDKNCPVCGEKYTKNGFDIPFQTFLGFKADKVPDIDLNFSGEYQTQMHHYVKDLLGADKIFKAGTITAVKDKMAYGYVKKYAEERNLILPEAEIERLALGITGVRKSTGQHPGGMMVVPSDMDIYDFSPVQYPANDPDKEMTTTHFDYHAIHDNILKLDMLGHDDPTMIKFLEDITGVNSSTIPLDDPETMSLFVGTEALKYKKENKYSELGTFAVPEFGTGFVQEMLRSTKPTTFSELVRISGLSHGTDVWLGNAADLIKNGTAKLSECICTRDDIMLYLISKGLDKQMSFKIMESVRKGKGLTDEWAEAMKAVGVPDWYIASCRKIKYMFPRAHAAAYVMSAFKIAWYKVHYPLQFYAAYFTVRADDFNAETMIYGAETAERRLDALIAGDGRGTAKDKTERTILEVCYEMYMRGFSFVNVDINKSQAKDFVIADETHILPPFNAIAGLGESVAQSIVEARNASPFESIEDLKTRTRLSQSSIEFMQSHGMLGNLPESSQISLF